MKLENISLDYIKTMIYIVNQDLWTVNFNKNHQKICEIATYLLDNYSPDQFIENDELNVKEYLEYLKCLKQEIENNNDLETTNSNTFSKAVKLIDLVFQAISI